MHQPKKFETGNILARLKSETETAHRETEKQISLEREEFSVQDYLDLLIRFYSFYRLFEPQIETSINTQNLDFDYSERLKNPKILADLKTLGMDEKAISNIHDFSDFPAIDSAERIFGTLYVIEGSTLGGQVISRQLNTKFGFDQANGAAFFSGYGTQTGKMWNDFRSSILNFAAQSPRHDEIIDAATATFEKIGHALGRKDSPSSR